MLGRFAVCRSDIEKFSPSCHIAVLLEVIFVYIAGDLERLRRYWMTGACKPGKQEHKSSDPLALEQFLSAFLLLMSGILLAALLLFLEHLYFKYARTKCAKTDQPKCCALLSLVSQV